jgi:peptidyl-prolyl cis-trans isomerase B (cyclophilin B)
MNANYLSILVLFSGLFTFGCVNNSTQKDKIQAENVSKETQNQTTKEKQTMVLISTTMGDMKAVLYNETPAHRDNFIKLAKEGYFDGTLFHRVIDGFMVQGGDPDSKNAPKGKQLGQGGPGYTIPAEFNQSLIHKKGALAAARMGDNVNPQKASSGSQFYIAQGKSYSYAEIQNLEMRMGKKFNQTQKDAYTSVGGVPFLDYEYTVFGEVVEGLDVIDKIAKAQKDRFDRPLQDIMMKVTIIEEK